jgi:hypothetical protein
MDADQVAALQALIAPTGWLDRTAGFARALRRQARTPNGLLIVGTRAAEPWHMTAHLASESEYAGIPELTPTLIRWTPPPGAPAHLAVGLDRLSEAGRRETLLVVSQEAAPAELLERVHDVRRAGAAVFALDQGDPELDELAHEFLQVSPALAPMSFEGAQHLVSAATVTGLPDPAGRIFPPRDRRLAAGRPHDRSLRGRLARVLDAVSGTQPDLHR